jgi:hypothetical protein
MPAGSVSTEAIVRQAPGYLAHGIFEVRDVAPMTPQAQLSPWLAEH